MGEDETFPLKPPEVLPSASNLRKDELDIVGSPADILAIVAAAVSNGAKGNWLALGRLGQAALKGELSDQFMHELEKLKDQGKLADDFMKKPRSLETWTDIMSAIDNGENDAEKLTAMKAMFYAMNKTNTADGARILAYQLFQIAKRLTSGELLLLKTIYGARGKTSGLFAPIGENQIYASQWVSTMATELGHGLGAMVEYHEAALVDHKLISPRIGTERLGVQKSDARLTDLGMRFCQNILTYQTETEDVCK